MNQGDLFVKCDKNNDIALCSNDLHGRDFCFQTVDRIKYKVIRY